MHDPLPPLYPLVVDPVAPDPLFGADPRPAVVAWQRLVDAGLIGGNPPMPAEVLASIRAAEAIFCRRAGGVW